MLQKVERSSVETGTQLPLLNVSRIHPDTTIECYAFVRGGQHKFTKTGKPFITLYLQDTEGVVIPGYVFDLDNFKAAGLELTKVIHSVVKLRATENYLPRYGMSVIVERISIVTQPDTKLMTTFVGTVGDMQANYNDLIEGIKRHLGVKVNFPYTICTSSYMDYYQGRVGGQCLHYLQMLRTLEVWSVDMSKEEVRQLFVSFALYVFVHNNYVAAVERGDDDIGLVNTLTASVSKYMEVLNAGTGASEVIHLFFGYTPKDLFVRMVHQASEVNLRAVKELNAYRALPISREGDAGYGTIKRYAAEGT